MPILKRNEKETYETIADNNMARKGDLDAIIDYVNDAITSDGNLEADVISEETSGSGVTVDGVLLKDSEVNTDTINEGTAATGVTIDGVLIKDGSITSATSPVTGFPVWNGVDPSDWITFIDDFITIPIDNTTKYPNGYTVVTDDAGGAENVFVDALGGWINVSSHTTDNDATNIHTQGQSFIFATDKKFVLKCRVQLTEANTDDANWLIGVSDTVDVDLLVDDGAGPAVSFDGAFFYKVDGTMKIGFISSNLTVQVDKADLATFVSGTIYNLAFVYDYGDGTTGSITPYVDGVAGAAHAITIAGLEEMYFVMGVKSGLTNAESLLVDYIAIAQERR